MAQTSMMPSYPAGERTGAFTEMDTHRGSNGEQAASRSESSSFSSTRTSRLAVSDLLAGPEKRSSSGDASDNASQGRKESDGQATDPAIQDRRKSKDYSLYPQEIKLRPLSVPTPSWNDERENRPSGIAMNAPRDRSSSTSSGARVGQNAAGVPGSSESAPSGPGDGITAYQYAAVQQVTENRANIEYILTIREQPKHSRMCGVGEKADRRPIDPAPIIQLRVVTHDHPEPKGKAAQSKGEDDAAEQKSKATEIRPLQEARSGIVNTTVGRTGKDLVLRRGVPVRTDWGEGWEDKTWYLENPYYFMYAMLADAETDEELHLLGDGKTRYTTGSCVSCLYHLKDIDGSEQGFFVFPDLSIRVEGRYRLKLCLFETIGHEVHHCKSVYSTPFNVYTAKRFPGMEESTLLSKSFADQGLKVRVRKNPRARRQRGAAGAGKRKDTLQSDDDSDGDGDMSGMHAAGHSPSFKRPRNYPQPHEQPGPYPTMAQGERSAHPPRHEGDAQQWRSAQMHQEARYDDSQHYHDPRAHEAGYRGPPYPEAHLTRSPEMARARYEDVHGGRDERFPSYVPSHADHERSGPPPLPALRRHVSSEVPQYPQPPPGPAYSADPRAAERGYEERQRFADPRRLYETPRELERPVAYERDEYAQRHGAHEQMIAAQRARGHTIYEGGRHPGPAEGYMQRRSPPPPGGYERHAPGPPMQPHPQRPGLAPPMSPSRYLDTRDRAVSDPYGHPQMSSQPRMGLHRPPDRLEGGPMPQDPRNSTRLPPMHVALGATDGPPREAVRPFSGPGGEPSRPNPGSYHVERYETPYHASQPSRLPMDGGPGYRDRDTQGAPYGYGQPQRGPPGSAGAGRPISPFQQQQGAHMHPPPPPSTGARYSPTLLHGDRAQHMPPPLTSSNMTMQGQGERAGVRLPPPPTSATSPIGERRFAHPPPPPPPHQHGYGSYGRQG